MFMECDLVANVGIAARRHWLTGVRPGLGLGDQVHGTFSLVICGLRWLKRKERPMGALSGIRGVTGNPVNRLSRKADAPVPRERGSG